jgi:methylated-DNA-protein-cysteine methyltransferase related protein
MRKSSSPLKRTQKNTDPDQEELAARYAPFTARAIVVIRSIPRGKVATYGQVAGVAGSPLAARQVVRVLHTLSRAESLPWHRVIRSTGAIALPRGAGFEMQKGLLESEGVKVSSDGKINLKKHLWVPRLAL